MSGCGGRARPAVIVLAAGSSARMRGADKLLETVEGEPLVLRAARAACRAAEEAIVVIPDGGTARAAWLVDLPLRVLPVGERAMSASLRAGIAACRSDAATIHLADMPEIGAAELEAQAAAWAECDAPILQATAADGRPGQPVTFARSVFPEILRLRGDGGARPLLDRHPVAWHPLRGEAALIDLDTPEEWAAWRAASGTPV